MHEKDVSSENKITLSKKIFFSLSIHCILKIHSEFLISFKLNIKNLKY